VKPGPRIKTILKDALRGKVRIRQSRYLLGKSKCFADGVSHFYILWTSSRFVERSQPWSGLSAALSELIV